MPVTARLSQKFYEKFGEDVTQELVDWFNNVDATYRGDLREINEVNFGRFDAKLEQRIADVRAEIRSGLASLRGEMLAEMGRLRGDLTAEVARAQAATVKWMFTFWAPTALAIVGTAIGVVMLLARR